MDLLSQTALFVSVVGFALGLSTLAKNPKNTLFLSFAILAGVISGWALSFFVYQTLDIAEAYRLHLAFNIWVAPAAIFFIRILTRPTYSFGKRWIVVSLTLSSLLTGTLALGLDSIQWIVDLIYFSPTLIALQILFLFFGEKKALKSLSPVARAKRNLIYIGALVVLNTSLLDHVPSMGTAIPVAGNILLCIYLYLVSQTISHQKTLNFWALLTRFLVLAVVALMLAALYSSVFNWIKSSFPLFFVNSLIASVLILILIEPLQKGMGWITNFLIQKTQKKLLQTIQKAESQLHGITTQQQFNQAIWNTTQELFHPEICALFLLNDEGTRYRKIHLSSDETNDRLPKEISANHPLVEYVQSRIARYKIPVVIDSLIENEIDRSVTQRQSQSWQEVLQVLRRMDCNLVIPLVVRGKFFSFITLKVQAHENPEPHWGQFEWIYPYYEQAAKTLQNLEFFSKRREKERLAELGQMAAGLAHEIRNPLGAIKGAIQFIDAEENRPEKEFLKIILEETHRLDHVVTRFLEFSKPKTQEFRKIDLNPLVEKTIQNLKPGLTQKISISLEKSEEPAWVQGDQEQLQQVLINLILNSVQALEPKSDRKIHVAIQSLSHPLDPPEVTLTIEDNGNGIPQDHMEKIFLPFFTTSHQGTGLGLSISQNIIESHRGNMKVQSQEGVFTRFIIEFPKGASA